MELRLEKVSVTMGKRNILEDVSLSLLEGLTFVAGLNGSGKSTLLRAVAGLVPMSGSITLIHNGSQLQLHHMRPQERARLVALLPQRVTQGFGENVLHFVRMGRFPHLGWLQTYSSEDTQQAVQALERVQGQHLSDRLTDSLSGGELQKVLLARALCQDSPILLLDEPTASLDPKASGMVNELMVQVAQSGKVVICASHDMGAFATEGARLLGIKQGRLVMDFPTGAANAIHLHQTVYS